METWLLDAQIEDVYTQSAPMSAAGFAEPHKPPVHAHKPPAVARASCGYICNMNSEVGKGTNGLGRLVR